MQDEFEKCEDEIKEIVFEIVLKANRVESKIKKIISNYVGSEKTHFVNEVILNSSLMNISSKVKILKHILKKEKLDIDEKTLSTSLNIVMNKRNVIVHSDSLSPDIDVDIDVDYVDGGCVDMSSYSVCKPAIQLIQNSELRYDDIEKVYKDFNKYFDIVFTLLNEIESNIKNK